MNAVLTNVKAFYRSLIIKYAILPTTLLLCLLILIALVYNLTSIKEKNALVAERNSEIANNILDSFFGVTKMIAQSSHSAIAVKYGDFAGYRRVVLPWVQNDSRISGLALFAQSEKVVEWKKDGYLNKFDLQLSDGALVAVKDEVITISHRISDNFEQIGAMVFATDANLLGLNKLNIKTSLAKGCKPLASAGLLYICPSQNPNSTSYSAAVFLLAAVIGLAGILLILSNILGGSLTRPVAALHSGLNQMQNGVMPSWDELIPKDSIPIFMPIAKHISDTIHALELLKKDLLIHEDLNRLAAQVSHDIRSPLAVLKIAVKSSQGLSAEQQTLIANAVHRIDEVANNLLVANRSYLGKSVVSAISVARSAKFRISNEAAKIKAIEIGPLVESIVAEKRVQFSKHLLELKSTPQAMQATIFVNPETFQCIVSNLMNNAYEALNEEGWVKVEVQFLGDFVGIVIADNGKGIPPNILPHLMQPGSSFGKENEETSGYGLGLYNAKLVIESYEGSLDIVSKVNSGTTITLKLPYLLNAPVAI